MKVVSRIRICFVLGLMIGVVFPTLAFSQAVSSGEPENWAQADATKLAGQLAEALSDVAQDPGLAKEQLTAMQQREHQAALVGVRRMTEISAELARKLKAGRGYYQTRPIFESFLNARAQTSEHGRASRLPAKTIERIESVRELISQLEVLYAES